MSRGESPSSPLQVPGELWMLLWVVISSGWVGKSTPYSEIGWWDGGMYDDRQASWLHRSSFRPVYHCLLWIGVHLNSVEYKVQSGRKKLEESFVSTYQPAPACAEDPRVHNVDPVLHVVRRFPVRA